MPTLPIRGRAALVVGSALTLVLALSGCSAAPAAPPPEDAVKERVPLGLMTSLPLYWPPGAGLADLATGAAGIPWQRQAIERGFDIVPLDTLTPIPALSPDAPDTDPLAGLERLAVIQPRGLSPGDNVALDRWVRGGGLLLLILDPALTGDYDLPLGDPRRPVDTALIPPVVKRWGLAISVSAEGTAEGGLRSQVLPDFGRVPLAHPGTISVIATHGERGDHCVAIGPNTAMAQCRIGNGQVLLIADAAIFEHRELAGEGGAGLLAVLAAAFR